MESILPWLTSAMTIMPFLATSVFTALLTSSNDLLEATVTRSAVKVALAPKLTLIAATPMAVSRSAFWNKDLILIVELSFLDLEGPLRPSASECGRIAIPYKSLREFECGIMASAGSDNTALLERLRRRDPEALTEAVREHARPLLRAARAMGFREDEAEDIVQEVYMTFLARLDHFEGRSQLRTWLFGILHHKAMERRRAFAVEAQADPIDAVFESRFDVSGKWSRPPADLERLFMSKEIGHAIRGCMEDLPGNQRQVFVLREVEGLDTTEICKILEVTVTNFGVLMHRARARLRECLEAKGWSRQ